MSFSRDDRLLASAGNYLDNTVVSWLAVSVLLFTSFNDSAQVVWDLYTGNILAAAQTDEPV